MTTTRTPMPLSADALQALIDIARDAIVTDIQTECVRVAAPGEDTPAWYDTRPMTDPREHAPQVLDMTRRALEVGEAMRIITRHPQHQHLVRLAPQA